MIGARLASKCGGGVLQQVVGTLFYRRSKAVRHKARISLWYGGGVLLGPACCAGVKAGQREGQGRQGF
jgi:hypothetical protein